MNHQGVTLTELVFQFFNKAKENVSSDKTVGSPTTPKKVGSSDCKATKGDTCLKEIQNCVNFWCNAKGKTSSEAVAQCDSENRNPNSRSGIRVKCGGCTISNKNDYVCKGSGNLKPKPTEIAACSSTCMEEVTKHCIPHMCKTPDVSTLAAAAQKCQEQIKAQNTHIKAKCPAPCKVSAEVLKQGGACPENNNSDKPTEKTPETNQGPNRMIRTCVVTCMGDDYTVT